MGTYRCQKLFIFLLMVAQLISIIIISYLIGENFILKQNIYNKLRISGKQQRNIKSSLPQNIPTPSKSQWKRTTNNLEKEIVITASNITSESQVKRTKENLRSSSINDVSKRSHKRPRQFTPSMITIVVFKPSSYNWAKNFNKTFENIRRLYPTSLHLFNKDESLNTTISRVETEYFFVLEEGVMVSDRKEESIHKLWDALERFPDIDFIGGSYLAGDKLHVACHRYRLCRWTFSVSYEYERSLGNVMICDGTSSSFMGRRKSINKIRGFDPSIGNTLVVSDFFLRAKASNKVVVGTLPDVMFLVDHFSSLYELWQARDISKDLVPFAVKHKVFIFKDNDGNSFDLCDQTSPLRGKDICDEKIAHNLMLGGGHWAYKGVFAYPFMLKYLEITLLEVIKFFQANNVTYTVDGGVSLGAIKTRSILPWEAGDIDMQVYGMSIIQVLQLIKPWAKKNGYLVNLYQGKAVHIFCTPKEVGSVSGGLATIFADDQSTKHPEIIRIKTNGIWVCYERQLVQRMKIDYGEDFLQQKVYQHEEIIKCKIKGHNACLPNFKSIYRGRAGTLRDFYCQS